MRLKLERRQRIVLYLVIVLVTLNISSRIYIRARLWEFNAIVRCYERLAGAYDAGGRAGIEKEIERMQARAKRDFVHRFLNNVSAKLDQAKDPKPLLQEMIAQKKEKVNRLGRILLGLNIAIITILLIRITINLILRARKK